MSADDQEALIVVGGGQAAAQLIEVTRQNGFGGRITLVSEEAILPYQRPPLSKQFLIAGHDRGWLLYRPRAFYEKHRVECLLGNRCTSIDRENGTIIVDGDSRLCFDKLAIATGARARRLAVPGAELPFYIRSVADAERLRADAKQMRRAVIVGGGFIGLEAAAILTQRGIKVALLCASGELVPRLGTAEVSAELADFQRRHGIDLAMNAVVGEVQIAKDKQLDVRLEDGRTYRADAVIAGIGAIPNIELAVACGLGCDDGINVDDEARTSDPAIFAAGDCTNHPNALLCRRLRLETVHNAVEQGRTAGATIAGVSLPYAQIPWVWSDQFDLRLQCVGLAEGLDRAVLRGNPATGSFSYFYFIQHSMLAVTCFNQPLVFGAARRLLNEQIPVDPAEASDPAFDLSSLLHRRARLDFDVPWPTRAEKRIATQWGHG